MVDLIPSFGPIRPIKTSLDVFIGPQRENNYFQNTKVGINRQTASMYYSVTHVFYLSICGSFNDVLSISKCKDRRTG